MRKPKPRAWWMVGALVAVLVVAVVATAVALAATPVDSARVAAAVKAPPPLQ